MTLNAPINIDLAICCFQELEVIMVCVLFIIPTYTKEDIFLKVIHKPIHRVIAVNGRLSCQYDEKYFCSFFLIISYIKTNLHLFGICL